jgi:hypothetical protein
MTATAMRMAQPTWTDGIADSWSALKPATLVYTDSWYRTAVSTIPACGSIRGGATGMSWISRQSPVRATSVVRQRR